jgi:beta-glucosidase
MPTPKKLLDLCESSDSQQINTVEVTLRKNQSLSLVIETQPFGGAVDLHLLWNAERAGADVMPLILEQVKDADLILFAGGLDGHMEAEENDLRAVYEGFNSGDRTRIEIPQTQTALIQALASSNGKRPVVLINMTGSATAMPWEAEHLPAIVQAWYPGQAGGQAIADILLGKENPSGRLPLTFYASTEDLPSFEDYAMAPHSRMRSANADDLPASPGRTYRYFKGKPLWPFGHGLSYTQFSYANLSLSAQEGGPGDTITISVDVKNIKDRAGDEVLQLYVRPADEVAMNAPIQEPRQRLVDFKRVSLAPAQTQRVQLRLPIRALQTWDISKKTYAVRAGAYIVEVGRSSADIPLSMKLTVR